MEELRGRFLAWEWSLLVGNGDCVLGNRDGIDSRAFCDLVWDAWVLGCRLTTLCDVFTNSVWYTLVLLSLLL